MTIQFVRDREGRYRLKGDADAIVLGAVIEVPKKGSDMPVLKRVRWVSAPFDIDGVQSVYGYFGNDICQTCRDAECQPNVPGQPDETQCQACTLEALGLLR